MIYLIKHAGRDTVTDIATVLERQRHDVRREAARRGLNVRLARSSLSMCPVCCQPRSVLDVDGVCRVCNLGEFTRTVEMRIAMELSAAPADARHRLGGLFMRGDWHGDAPPHPKLPKTAGMSLRQRQRAMDDHARRVEARELLIARREYDAARQRLHRLREAMRGEI